jgi:CRP/FNR family transcriptional regulator
MRGKTLITINVKALFCHAMTDSSLLLSLNVPVFFPGNAGRAPGTPGPGGRGPDRIRPGPGWPRRSQAVRGFFLVLTGKVKLFRLLRGRQGADRLRVVGPGEPFCLGSLFGEGVFPAHAETLARSRLVFFPGEVLRTWPAGPHDPFLFPAGDVQAAQGGHGTDRVLVVKGLSGRIAGFFLLTPGTRSAAVGVWWPWASVSRELAKNRGGHARGPSRALGRMGRQGLAWCVVSGPGDRDSRPPGSRGRGGLGEGGAGAVIPAMPSRPAVRDGMAGGEVRG